MDQFSFETNLRNGARIQIRPVGPEDRHLLEVGFEHLSDQSRYFRFLAFKSKLTSQDLNLFSQRNDDQHTAIGALDLDASIPAPVGIARYVRLPDRPVSAEVAITVVDSHHGLGLGSLLIGVLAFLATRQRITSFVAMVDKKNEKMLHLFGELDAREDADLGEELELAIPLHSNSEEYPKSKTGDAMRQAYKLAEGISF